ncbi:hypothetical protein KHQ06_33470 [Nocardia tengchongensis]|uniref:Uncharacterized protein n=1 Tax=Nocardia tengchongensis TaxID=2055889 RepID=A0ABX8CNG3_9NOCA|nr:hypothetical protein [Nocardia tengchongensis]QVI20937.1 hypothetical protein KHQ06_33470 [Nocardia tengchongensis]
MLAEVLVELVGAGRVPCLGLLQQFLGHSCGDRWPDRVLNECDQTLTSGSQLAFGMVFP